MQGAGAGGVSRTRPSTVAVNSKHWRDDQPETARCYIRRGVRTDRWTVRGQADGGVSFTCCLYRGAASSSCAMCQEDPRLCQTVWPERRGNAPCQLARAVLAPAGFRWCCKHSGKGERTRQRADRPSQRMCTATKTQPARGLTAAWQTAVRGSSTTKRHQAFSAVLPAEGGGGGEGGGVPLHAMSGRERERQRQAECSGEARDKYLVFRWDWLAGSLREGRELGGALECLGGVSWRGERGKLRPRVAGAAGAEIMPLLPPADGGCTAAGRRGTCKNWGWGGGADERGQKGKDKRLGTYSEPTGREEKK